MSTFSFANGFVWFLYLLTLRSARVVVAAPAAVEPRAHAGGHGGEGGGTRPRFCEIGPRRGSLIHRNGVLGMRESVAQKAS